MLRENLSKQLNYKFRYYKTLLIEVGLFEPTLLQGDQSYP